MAPNPPAPVPCRRAACSISYGTAVASTFTGPWADTTLNFIGSYPPIPGLSRPATAILGLWDYTVTVTVDPPNLAAGSSATGTVHIAPVSGYNQDVDLSATIDTPGCTGCTLTFPSGTRVHIAGAQDADYLFSTTGPTPPGNYSFTIHAKAPAGGAYVRDRFDSGSVNVMGLALSVSPALNDFFPGETKQYTVTALSQFGFVGQVNFTMVWPGGVPVNITPTWSATFCTIAVAGNSCSVTYQVVVGVG
jgi:hypothetical protein